MKPFKTLAGDIQMIKEHGDSICLVGTAHISHKSAREVKKAITEVKPDIVAVELDRARYLSLIQKEKWRNTSVFKVIREGRSGLMLTQLFLSTIQKQMGLEEEAAPGMEMVAAIKEARAQGVPIALVDRDISVTFKSGWQNMGFFEKIKMFWYGINAIIGFSEEEDGEDGSNEKMKIDDLLEEDTITVMINSLKEFAPGIGKAFIDERDTYIAQRILALRDGREGVIKSTNKRVKRAVISLDPGEDKKNKKKGKSKKRSKARPTGRIPAPVTPKPGKKPEPKKVLAVLGAGHLNGVVDNLKKGPKKGEIERLEKVKKKRFSIGSILKYTIPSLFFGLVAYLIWQGDYSTLGDVILWWFLINGTLSALGALLARGHPLSIITAFIAAPLTSLNPLLAAGWFAGIVEGWLRPPKVSDVEKLGSLEKFRDFFNNRLVRLLMVTALANLGSVAGTYLGAAKIIQILI